MKKTKISKIICKGLLFIAIEFIFLMLFSISALADTPYEVTKSGGALIRTSYSENASSVRRAPEGSILWVVSSKKNSAGNTWYKLNDGYWIYSGNVKAHSCTWSLTSSNNPTCTTSGAKKYKCNKCGKTKSVSVAAYGHKYNSNVCTACGDWNTSSLKSKSSVNNVKYYITTDGAKVHSGPYGGCKTVKTLSKGAQITVTEKIVNASNNIWYKYSGGYIFSDYVVVHNTCSWDIGSVTKTATCTNTGTKVQYCTICGKSKTTTLPTVSHKYESNVCKVCGDWKTSSIKSKSSVNNVKYYVTTEDAKVHSGPYAGCKTIITLPKGTEIIVTEKLVNASNNIWYKYSEGYIFADYVVAHNSCSWDSGSVTKKATCTNTGTKVQYCNICGKSKTTTIKTVSHKYEDNVCKVCGDWKTSSIKSNFSVNNIKYYVTSEGAKVRSGPYGKCKTVTTLSKGTEIIVTEEIVNASNNTWYKYSEGYIFADYVAAHDSCSWDSGTVTKKATCTKTGTKVQYCTICGKSKKTTISKASHKYTDNVCKVCGNWKTSSLKSKSSVDNIKYYITAKDVKVHSGPYSGCKTVTTLPKGTEIIVTEKVVNASNNTWYKYNEGYIFADYAAAHNSCSWDKGSVTKKATCSKTGTKVQHCTICGKSKKTTIKKASHKYKDNVCKVCGAWKKSSLKSNTPLNNIKYYVTAKEAKVRSGPYGGCKTVKTLSKGTVIIVTEKVVNASNNTWYKYKDGYIYGEHVKDYALKTAKITLNSKSLTLYVGQEKKLKATVKGPSSSVTWKSSDTSVATVDSKGKITGKKAGTCTITAKANGKTATCKITIKQLAAPKDVVIKTVESDVRKFEVSHKAVSGADGYVVTYNSMSGTKSKVYTGTSAKISVSKSKDCTYKCSVRAYKLIDGKKYYGKSSKTYNVHVHNNEVDLQFTYKIVDNVYHYETVKNNFTTCIGCKKIIKIKTAKKKHSFTCGVCQSCGLEESHDYVIGKFYPTVGPGPSYSSSEKKNGINPIYVAIKYSDKYFKGDSSSFSNDLCKLSAIGAATSYTKEFGKSFLNGCGFKGVKAENSSDQASTSVAGENDHARYIIGYKKLLGTDITLVAVLVNGYTTGRYEWISNFNVGESGLHEGFSKAAEEITSEINKYIKDKKINTSKLKIWITGHSRGGAVAGMTAVNLNELYGTENVYAYGFATPNGVPDSIAKEKETNTNNIFNIINSGDFVPYVVPSSWDFQKFGSVKTLTVDSTAKKIYSELSKDINGYTGLTVDDRKAIISVFCEYSPNREAYYTVQGSASPSDFGRALGLFLSSKGLCKEAVELLAKCGISDGDSLTVLGQMFYNGSYTTSIHEAHCMETYIAMIYSEYK